MKSENLSADRLKELLSYEPSSGRFFWLASPNNRIRVGQEAGALSAEGYLQISVDGRRYSAHRLAWLAHYGRWPDQSIDHIDGDKTNNRINNLRDVCQSQNMQNLRSANRDSRTGILGVTKVGTRWKAQMGVDGKQVFLGLYQTPEEAHTAYVAAKRLRGVLQKLTRTG